MSVAPDKRDKYYALANSVSRSLARLVAAVLVARLCGPSVYAVFVIAVAVEVVATSLPNAFHLAPMLSLGPGLPDSYREAFYARVVRAHVRWSLAAGLFGGCVLPVLAGRELGVAASIAFAGALVGGGVLQGVRAQQQARFRARAVFWCDLGALVVPVAVVLAMADANPQGMLCGYFAAVACSSVAAAYVLARLAHPAAQSSDRLPDSVTASCRQMGVPMAVGSIANSACSRVQPFVLQAAAGAAAVGVFGATATAIGPMRLLAMAMSSVVRPRFALQAGAQDMLAARRLLQRSCLLLAGCGVLGVLVAWLIGAEVVALAFGSGFEQVAEILPLAVVFASLEAVAATLVVALQTLRPGGAAAATRLRIAVSLLALGVVWPACLIGHAAGAFAALCGTELLFLVLVYARLVGGDAGRDARTAFGGLGSAPEEFPSSAVAVAPMTSAGIDDERHRSGFSRTRDS